MSHHKARGRRTSSNRKSASTRRRTKVVLLFAIIFAVGLTVGQNPGRAVDLVLTPSVGIANGPSVDDVSTPGRQLIEPAPESGNDVFLADAAVSARIDNRDDRTAAAELAPAISEAAEQRTGASEAAAAVEESSTVEPTRDSSTTSTAAAQNESSGNNADSNNNSRPAANTNSAASADRNNSAPPGQSSSATTTSRPAAPAVTEPQRTETTPTTPAFSAGGWVNPNSTGHRTSNLHQFPGPNDGTHGVTIDQAFLNEHRGAAWLSNEGGRPVISRIDASGRCLNIRVTLTLRDSYVNCPTRVQNDSWGFAGIVDDAPAVNILDATDVVLEYNTVTCSGTDANICGRNVRIGGRDAIVQYNDLSFARGAVSLFHGTEFRFNYVHDLSFGFDPTRANNPNDNVTHNNVVNNLGYQNTLVEGNYIVARYGRVSAQPTRYTAPHYHGVYTGGVVEVGDPINGFTFTNYLQRGNGDGMHIVNNYVEASGRPFRCNSSSQHSSPSCADDISGNVFAEDYFNAFQPTALFQDKDGAGSISGSCNARRTSSGTQVLPSTSFGVSNTHQTSSC